MMKNMGSANFLHGIVKAAHAQVFQRAQLHIGVFPVDSFKQVPFFTQLIADGYAGRQKVFRFDEREGSVLDCDDVVGSQNADIRYDIRRGEAPAVAERSDIHQEIDVIDGTRCKVLQTFLRAERHALLEILKTSGVKLESAGRTRFDAVLTRRTVVLIHGQTVVFKRKRRMVAVVHADAAADAFVAVPVQPAFQTVDLTARPVGNAPHGDVFDGAAKAADAVPFDVGKVDQNIGIVDVSGDIDVPEGLEIHALFIKNEPSSPQQGMIGQPRYSSV